MKRTAGIMLSAILLLGLLPFGAAVSAQEEAALHHVRIEDTQTGEGMFEFSYSGLWETTTGIPEDSNGDETWTFFGLWRPTGEVPGFELRFYGHEISLYGVKHKNAGRAEVTLDGGDPKVAEFYSPSFESQALIVSYTGLEEGEHTLSFRLLDEGVNDVDVIIDFAEAVHYDIPLSTLSLSDTALILEAGEAGTLTTSHTPAYANPSLLWGSGDEAVVTVENGTVTARGPGSTRITVTDTLSGLGCEAAVTVFPAGIPFLAGFASTAYVSHLQEANPASLHWADKALQGETVSRLLFVEARTGDTLVPDVKLSGLTEVGGGSIPPGCITLRPVATTPGGYNVLAPAGTKEEPLPYGQGRGYWMDIDVPTGTLPGTYTGVVEIGAVGTPTLPLAVEIEVLALAQPAQDTALHSTPGFEAVQFPYDVSRYYGFSGDDFYTEEHIAFLRAYLDHYQKAGGNTAVIAVAPEDDETLNEAMVGWTLLRDGNWQFNFQHLDTYLELCLSMGIDRAVKCYGPAQENIFYLDEGGKEVRTLHLIPGSAEWQALWTAFGNSLERHIAQKGWQQAFYLDVSGLTAADIAILKDTDLPLGFSATLSLPADTAMLDQIDEAAVMPTGTETGLPGLSALADSRREKGATTLLAVDKGTLSSPALLSYTLWLAEAAGMYGVSLPAYGGGPDDSASLIYPDGNTEPLSFLASPAFVQLQRTLSDISKLRYIEERSPSMAAHINEQRNALVNEGALMKTSELAGLLDQLRAMTTGFSASYADGDTVRYGLELQASRPDGGRVEGTGYYSAGGTVITTASAAEGFEFTGWLCGGTVTSEDTLYTFTLETDTRLIARFQAVAYTLQLKATELAVPLSQAGTVTPESLILSANADKWLDGIYQTSMDLSHLVTADNAQLTAVHSATAAGSYPVDLLLSYGGETVMRTATVLVLDDTPSTSTPETSRPITSNPIALETSQPATSGPAATSSSTASRPSGSSSAKSTSTSKGAVSNSDTAVLPDTVTESSSSDSTQSPSVSGIPGDSPANQPAAASSALRKTAAAANIAGSSGPGDTPSSQKATAENRTFQEEQPVSGPQDSPSSQAPKAVSGGTDAQAPVSRFTGISPILWVVLSAVAVVALGTGAVFTLRRRRHKR